MKSQSKTSSSPMSHAISASEVALCDMPCPVEATLKVIGGRWKALVLYQLSFGKKRFNELRRLIPSVSQRMLTAHLRELEQDGVISRQVFAEVPPRVEYSLTETGRSLSPILNAMASWGNQHVFMKRAD